MEFSKSPMIKVYTRGPRGSNLAGSSPRARIVARLNDEEEEGVEDGARRWESQTARRIEGDLNWAYKYLQSDRASSLPRGQSRRSSSVTSSTDDLKARSPTPGRCNGIHSEETAAFGSRSTLSSSPMKFREDVSESNGSSVRSSRASASPLLSRRDFTSSDHLVVNHRRPPCGSVSPKISQPVTRTYNDLDRMLPAPGNPSAGGQRTKTSSSACVQRTKTPISGTRKKLRNVLCRSRNDPHYFDED